LTGKWGESQSYSESTQNSARTAPKIKKVGDGKFRTLADMQAEEFEKEKAIIDQSFASLTQLLDGPPSQFSANSRGSSRSKKGNGPSKEFEEHFLKMMDPNAYKKKFGGPKQDLMPPAYLMKKPKPMAAPPNQMSFATFENQMMSQARSQMSMEVP